MIALFIRLALAAMLSSVVYNGATQLYHGVTAIRHHVAHHAEAIRCAEDPWCNDL
jgi:hypothetical protein